MAEYPAHCAAHSFSLSGAIALTVTDQGGAARSAVLQSSGGTYYRAVLGASGAGGTSHHDAKDLAAAVAAALNGLGTYWALELTLGGHLRFRYLGTGTGTITLPATIAQLLGWGTDTTVGPLATNATETGQYLPSHVVLAFALADDSGWTRRAPRTAVAVSGTGQVYGWTEARPGAERRGTWALAPSTWDYRAEVRAASAEDYPGTPAWGHSDRWASATEGPASAQPWGINDTLATSPNAVWAVAWGNWADVVAATSGRNQFDLCQLSPESWAAAQALLSAAGFAGRASVGPVAWILAQGGVGKVRP